MAHIDRRDRNGAVRYVARYVDPTGRERSKSFTRRADAQKYLAEQDKFYTEVLTELGVAKKK